MKIVAEVSVVDNSKEISEQFSSAMLRALTECGLVAEGYAKLLCPVDTGRLRNSIGSMVVETPREQAAYVGTNVEYGPHVELGTRHQRAQPYLKPAVADHADEYRKIIEEEGKSG